MSDFKDIAQKIVKEMTKAEKLLICSGKNFWNTIAIERLNIPSILLTDGPHGVRKEKGDGETSELSNSIESICYPLACLSACSFDVDLLEQMGVALGEEARKENVSVLLGPGVNHKRSPLCGRNFEYFSEDPLLSGKLGAAYVKGVQSQGVGTSLKHFACNSQEYARLINNSIIDERALREIYLKAFEIVIKEADPWTVMPSYNKINGTYSCENEWLLNKVARNEWGFKGIFVSDWGAMSSAVESFKNGLDLEMPNVCKGTNSILEKALREGKIKEDDINKVAIRMVELALKAQAGKKIPYVFDKEHNLSLARKIAEESAVLLKNDSILPLSKNSKIALIGSLAKKPRYQGNGSSLINPITLDNLYDTLKKENIEFDYSDGYLEEGLKESEEEIVKAKEIALNKDAVIIVVGLPKSYEAEGYDRNTLDMPKAQETLINELAKVNTNIIVVLQCGAPIDITWLSQVKGILLMYLAGCQGGKATYNILFGNVNPSGKLAETWPINLKDTPSFNYFANDKYNTMYKESIYTGYRYYDTVNKEVLFPFGYGLSYSEFSYSDLVIEDKVYNENEKIEICFKLQNKSEIAGKEIVQVYINHKNPTIFKPYKELKYFTKVNLDPLDTKDICVILDKEAFAYYNVINNKWDVETGEYTIMIGSSSQNIKLEKTIRIKSNETMVIPCIDDVDAIYYHPEDPHFQKITDEEFETLIKREVPKSHNVKPITIDSSVEEISNTFFGKIIVKIMNKELSKRGSDSTDAQMGLNMFKDLPLRAIGMGGVGLTRKNIDGLVDLCNGKFFKGIRKLLSKK